MHTLTKVVLVLALTGAGANSRAEVCAPVKVLDSIPPEGARDVPVNAALFARYSATADYRGETVLLGLQGGPGEPVPAAFDDAEGTLRVIPAAPLIAGASYVIVWPGLQGINNANRGVDVQVAFTVGAGPDAQAPRFDGLSGIEWDWTRRSNPCSDGLEDRFAFDLEIGGAQDDGGPGALTLIVFQTRGPAIGEPAGGPRQVFIGSLPAPGQTVRVEQTINDALGPVCFAAIVRDSTARVSGGETEVCVTTVDVPFFTGCSFSPRSRRAGVPLLFMLVAACALARARSSRAAS